MSRSLPVYPDKQTIAEPVGTSHLSYMRTNAPQLFGAADPDVLSLSAGLCCSPAIEFRIFIESDPSTIAPALSHFPIPQELSGRRSDGPPSRRVSSRASRGTKLQRPECYAGQNGDSDKKQ
jgi:hypothetical protein